MATACHKNRLTEQIQCRHRRIWSTVSSYHPRADGAEANAIATAGARARRHVARIGAALTGLSWTVAKSGVTEKPSRRRPATSPRIHGGRRLPIA